jgi:NAD(P)-dependent dehydrogenase (short-subunit alcohol dehydrogenase family)
MSIETKTILVTGATDGLGKLVALKLAEGGARVLLHGRDQAKGEAVLAEIKAATGNPNLEFYCADLAVLSDVRDLAKAVTARHSRLEVLINNAGVYGGEARQVTGDGQELHFQVNYLAPFLLTELLLPVLRASAPARIVNVSSGGQAPVDFDDVMLEHGYSAMRGYCQSKLAQIMNTIDLAAQLEGSGVTVTSLHPGTYMNTKMVIGSGITPITPVEEGVEATYRLAVSPEVEGQTGVFFNQQTLARANGQAYDEVARRRLRDLSLRLAGLPAD